jgi:hypothetical protein
MVVSADAGPALATVPGTASNEATQPIAARRTPELMTDLVTRCLLTIGEVPPPGPAARAAGRCNVVRLAPGQGLTVIVKGW